MSRVKPATPLKAVLIGYPVAHTLSPALYSFLNELLGNNHELDYSAVGKSSAELGRFFQLWKASPDTYAGVNVTIPHKENVLNYVDALDSDASKLGAVNLIRYENNKFIGHNTDAIGIQKTLSEHGVRLLDQNILILGAGGAARAAALAAAQERAARVFIWNRSPERATKLAHDLNNHFENTEFSAIDSVSDIENVKIKLLFQATSRGMLGHIQSQNDYYFNLDKLKLAYASVAFELIYTPAETEFTNQMNKRGLKTLYGIEMLVHQGIRNWELITSTKVDSFSLASQLREFLENVLKFEHRPLLLSGSTGSGKSTVGPILARMLGWNFMDLDQLIEQRCELSISQIFEHHGEEKFRDVERKCLNEALTLKRHVIAMGGGALADSASLKSVATHATWANLNCDLNTLNSRLANDANVRPLLSNLSSDQRLQKIKTMLELRQDSYRMAPYQINTTHLNPNQVAQGIRRLIFCCQNGDSST